MSRGRPVETPLLGGTANLGHVVRVGETVRRPMTPTSASTHRLLEHLEAVGFGGAPRFLGVDDQDREILSYVEGAAPIQPYPDWAHAEDALLSVAELLRGYHDAVQSFDPSAYAWPAPRPPDFGPILVSHNDPNLDNIVFRDGVAVGLIDFDLASPGSRIFDVATAARLWAPLRPDVDIRDLRRGDSLRRFRLFVDAYGVSAEDRRLLVHAVPSSHEWIYLLISTGAREGQPGFARYWTGDTPARAERARRWYIDHADELRTALT